MTLPVPEICVAPTAINLCMQRGQDTTFKFALAGDTGRVDITADDVIFSVLSAPVSGTVLVALTNGVGQHTDPTNGETEFTLTRAMTNVVAVPEETDSYWVYEVRRVQPGGEENVYVSGALKIQRSVVL